jgi:copper(I)-binding protein
MKTLTVLTIACILLATPSLTVAEGQLTVSDAWIPEAPPGMNVMAAFMIIRNDTGITRYLTGVSSDQFERVEMHRTVIENEKARMVRQYELTINSGDVLKFEPGGNHLMLFNPKKSLKKGDEIGLILLFKNEDIVSVKARVRKHSEMHSTHHGH